MTYRRKQVVTRDSTLKEPIRNPRPVMEEDSSALSSSSLATKAIRASSAHRDSSLSSAYGQSAISSSQDSTSLRSPSSSSTKGATTHKYTSMKILDEPKQGFWGGLARKTKAIIDDDNADQHSESPRRTGQKITDTASKSQYHDPYRTPEISPKTDSPVIRKGLGAIASSFNYIGNAFEEGIAKVENRTADIIQETRKLQLRKKSGNSEDRNQDLNAYNTRQKPQIQPIRVQPQMETDLEIQLKASRDVAMAMAAKAKLLLRELKTVKADLAFAKERCAQLEEENRVLRENKGKGSNLEDDDLIRLQLEALLAEKARLAQENSVFARENRFLREIVDYHQLTMQDVVYLDEGSEEVTEIYPQFKKLPSSFSDPISPPVISLSTSIHISAEERPQE